MKSTISKYKLKRELKNIARNVKSVMLSEVNSCGIVCLVNDKQDLAKNSKFKEELMNKGVRNIEMLYVIKDRKSFEDIKLPEENTLILKSETSMFNAPSKAKTKSFINKEFQILIDITQSNNDAVNYIVGLSKAYFKVGPLRVGELSLYDLEIQTNENNDFKYFCDQIVLYLEMIKTK